MFYDNFPEELVFKSGDKGGTHSSRTIMFDDLSTILDQIPPESKRNAYIDAIVKDNALHKNTFSTRKHSLQRLTELYLLDPSAPLFRVMLRFWPHDQKGRVLMVLLCALARDPKLRLTTSFVLDLRPGEELMRRKITDSLKVQLKDRLNDAILDKVIRNASSSWTQSGHLEGRVRKYRCKVQATPYSTVYALLLGYLQGIRGARLFDTEWMKVLDSSVDELRYYALEAKRLGILDLKIAGDVVEIGFNNLLTQQELREARVTN